MEILEPLFRVMVLLAEGLKFEDDPTVKALLTVKELEVVTVEELAMVRA